MIDGETLPGETDGRTTLGRTGADEDRGWEWTGIGDGLDGDEVVETINLMSRNVDQKWVGSGWQQGREFQGLHQNMGLTVGTCSVIGK
ncbi:hypothetical protein IMY05_005G0124900 [Salix suchowensis]|nr:hypothetical protein IMY05_005G0124900 [Salix suchowensis]